MLLDTAFDYVDHGPLQGTEDFLNCYEGGDDLHDLVPVAPWVCPIAGTAKGRARCSELLQHANGKPMLSVLASTRPLVDLVHYWQPYHWVHSAEPNDKQRFLLRFADTRTLALLPTQLSPAQWHTLRAPLAKWLILDRSGHLQELPPSAPNLGPVIRLELSTKTLAQMVDDAMPDTLLSHLAEVSPEDLSPALPRDAMHQNMCHVTALGKRHGVDNMPDLLALALCALQTNGRILQSAKLQTLLGERSYPPGGLADAIAALRLS